MGYSDEVMSLLAEGSKLYAAKKYDLASESYANACETYNGETGKDDADLLFVYGRALFQHGVSNSEVFGASGEGQKREEPEDDEEEKEQDNDNFQFCDDAPLADNEEIEREEDGERENTVEQEEQDVEGQVGAEANGEEDGNEEEDQSDFEVAWEILDLARTLFEQIIDENEDSGKDLKPPFLSTDSEETENVYVSTVKKLSETYDLLGEVSLEAENFSQAAVDLEKCLELREKLYDIKNSALIPESHYKLSLALEFCLEDPKSKEKCVEHMKRAIDAIKKKDEFETDEGRKKANAELLQDLLVRYNDLKRDPDEIMKQEKLDILKGILGEGDGSSNSAAQAINDLTSIVKPKPSASNVNDLTSAVKKRKPQPKDGDASKKHKK